MFRVQAESYYQEMNNAMNSMPPRDYAYLLLSCNVGLATPKYVPGTNMEWDRLVEKSMVLPYCFDPKSEPQAYCIPSVFWMEYAVGHCIFYIM